MESANLPGTRTLSQKLALRMLSIVSIPKLSSCGIGAIVGGNVDMSATGPISLANWKSAKGSMPNSSVAVLFPMDEAE